MAEPVCTRELVTPRAYSDTTKLVFALLATMVVVIDLLTVRVNCSILYLGLMVCYLELCGRSRATQCVVLLVALTYLGYFAGARAPDVNSYAALFRSYMLVNRTLAVFGVLLVGEVFRRDVGATAGGKEVRLLAGNSASEERVATRILLINLLFALLVYVTELRTPLEYNLSILYLPVAVIAVRTGARKYIWPLALGMIFLTFMGRLASRPPLDASFLALPPVNRILVSSMLLVIAAITSRKPAGAAVTPRSRAGTSLPRVAIISNARTPYRDHVQRRAIAELPQIQLLPVFTHGIPIVDWKMAGNGPREAMHLGENDRTASQHNLLGAPREWRKAGQVIQHLRRQNVSAVLLEGYSDAGRLRILAWCRRNDIPCFIWGDSNVRGESNSVLRNTLRHLLLPRILRRTSGVLCCGTLGREYYRSYGAEVDNTFFYPYEPDYDLICSMDEPELAAVRERFGLNADRKYMTFAGRLIAVKGIDLLIASFAAIAAERPDWDLLIVGDGELSESLHKQVPEALRARVRWTGFVDEAKTALSLIRLSEVLVIPSRHEPWGVVVNEAVAAGLAVVASSVVGAAAELVRDGVNGRLFTSESGLELTAVLRDVTTPETLSGMKAASARVLADWRQSADPIDGLRRALQSAGVVQ